MNRGWNKEAWKGKGKGQVGRAGERENEREGSDGRETARGS